MIDIHSIARALGGEFSGGQALVPGPGHGRNDRSLAVRIGRSGEIICHSFAGDPWRECLGGNWACTPQNGLPRGQFQQARPLYPPRPTTAREAAICGRAQLIFAARLRNDTLSRSASSRLTARILAMFCASIRAAVQSR